jgi:hypothetical protein
MTVPLDASFTMESNRRNNPATYLMSDGRTLKFSQPFARCVAGQPATSLVADEHFTDEDLYGDGRSGAHGGSRLSSYGGSIRIGEMRPGQTGMEHALKINLAGIQMLCMEDNEPDAHRWPAFVSDAHSTDPDIGYGRETNNTNEAMRMGSLLALLASTNLATMGFETEPAMQLAWTLQHYGAYVVDDSFAGYEWSVEESPDGSFIAQFLADYGFEFDTWSQADTPWSRDLQRIYPALHVVNNNSPSTIGGGGTPLRPMKPELIEP